MTNSPQTVTWILVAVGVILFLGAFFLTRGNDKETGEELSQKIADCERDLAAAYASFGTGTPATSTGVELQALIDRCSDIIERARE